MIYDWFKIFNYASFSAGALVSQTLTINFEGIGEKQVLITKGNYISVTYAGVFLPVEMSDKNPFAFDGLAVYRDPETDDVYLGLNGRVA